jgi:hypothetical protein
MFKKDGKMKAIADLAAARQRRREDRGPWPSEEALKYKVRELAEELSDAWAYAELLADSRHKSMMLELLDAVFCLLGDIEPGGIDEAFCATSTTKNNGV